MSHRARRALLALAVVSSACGDTARDPALVFVEPAEGAYVAGIARFEVTAAPADAVAEVVFSVGGVEVGRAAEPPFAVELDTSIYDDGPLIVDATGAGAAGADAGTPLSAAVTVKVDNAPPVLELLPPAAAFAEDGEQFAVRLRAADGNGITKVGAHVLGAGTDVAREVYDPDELLSIEFSYAEVRPLPVTGWAEVRVVATAVDGYGRQTSIDEPFWLGTRLRWTANVAGLVLRPPVVAGDGTIWVGATKVSPDEGRIVRLDPADGGELCDNVLGVETVYSGAQAGDLLVFGTSRAVRAFRRDDCGLAWTFGDPTGDPRSYWGTPAYDATAGLVYAADADGRIAAIDAATGAGALFANPGEEIQSSPVVAATGEVFVATVPGNLFGYDASGAALAWSPYATAGSVFGDPRLAPGALYFASMDTFLYALDPATGALRPGFGVSPDGFAIRATPALAPDGAVLIATIGGALHAIGSDGGALWEIEVGAISRGGAVVAGTADDWRAYLGSTNGDVYAVDAAGQLAWRAATGAEIQTYGALDATTFYTPSDDFRVYAYEIGPPAGP